MKDYSIMFAVLKHPYAQISKASAFIKKLNSRDLQDLADNRHSNPVIRNLAREFIIKRSN
jgi:hypothetical protein